MMQIRSVAVLRSAALVVSSSHHAARRCFTLATCLPLFHRVYCVYTCPTTHRRFTMVTCGDFSGCGQIHLGVEQMDE